MLLADLWKGSSAEFNPSKLSSAWEESYLLSLL